METLYGAKDMKHKAKQKFRKYARREATAVYKSDGSGRERIALTACHCFVHDSVFLKLFM